MRSVFSSRYINGVAKALIGALLVWALYRQVFSLEELAALWQTVRRQLQTPGQGWFWAAVFLTPANWGLETLKWLVLIRHFSPLSFGRAYRAILAGVTISMFTPNRIGEYGGRMLLVEARHNGKAIVATLVGSFSQWVVLIALGGVGSWYFAISHFRESAVLLHWAWALVAGFLLVLVYAFFHVSYLAEWVEKRQIRPAWKAFLKPLLVVRHYRRQTLWKALGYALLRYGVYTLQYYCLLKFFDIHPPLDMALAGIFTIFFIQTSLPLPPVLALLARGEAALVIWGIFSDQPLHILSATFSLFILNLAIPALLGMVVIVQTNVTKSLGYESVKNEKP